MENAVSRRRLQRDKDFTGDRLTTFRQVFLRHGLPGLILAIICLAIPGLMAVFAGSFERSLANPVQYTFGFVLIFAALSAYSWYIDRAWNASKLGWMLYLGVLSFWEEWVFRLALPHLLQGMGAAMWVATLLSAAVFGAAHYFTLRWKWQMCLAAFVGGLALGRQMNLQNDLLMVTAFHWIATYLNTPRPPGYAADGGPD